MKPVAAILAAGLCSVSAISSAATIYVSTNSPVSGPGDAWSNAYHTIQEAVNVATNGDTVLVTNGVYDTGGEVRDMSNRVAIISDITLQSVNGPEHTFIVGAADPVSPTRIA